MHSRRSLFAILCGAPVAIVAGALPTQAAPAVRGKLRDIPWGAGLITPGETVMTINAFDPEHFKRHLEEHAQTLTIRPSY